MITDSVKIFTPAKINLFLKILGRRQDGYHIIRSGITFINLFDQIDIKVSDKMLIQYSGPFKPSGRNYEDCIILKTLKFLHLDKNHNFNISVTKNIPVQGGLGSASTNAAGLIQGLELMKMIKKREPKDYVALGADIPSFLFKKNCLVTGIGEKLYSYPFSKYYFLLIKPSVNNSTKNMYDKLGYQSGSYELPFDFEEFEINDEDTGNDFEKFIWGKNKEVKNIVNFLEDLDDIIFSRMTGSGSCWYAVFENKEHAIKANEIFKSNFSNLWSCVCENNIDLNPKF
jgi:4-diphosphocytidyl-2-C-methyl-D-erythritol kinase